MSLAAVPGFTQSSNPFAGDAKAAEAGRADFRRHCSSCHGRQAEGGRAPGLPRGTATDADLFRIISTGIPGTEMGSYDKRLSGDEIWRVVAFIRSTAHSDTPIAGDATHGEELFWNKGACGNCHAVQNRGSRVGPDLSRIGRRRSAAYLRESLVAPSTDIPQNYSGVTVVARDGKSIRGLEKAIDDFSVVLQDFSGQVRSFNRSDVRSVSRDTQSLMPEYGKVLSPAELDNVLKYLSTLGATPQ